MEENNATTSGSYTVVLDNTSPKDVFKTLKTVVNGLGKDEDFYYDLIENTNLEVKSDDIIVSMQWSEGDIETQYIVFKLQENHSPCNDVVLSEVTEFSNGTYTTNTWNLG